MGREKKTDTKSEGEVESVTRKVHSGPYKDKIRTKQRLIAAVGKVIQKKGYAALTAPNIARECGLDKRLVWTYFGGIDQLVSEYIQHKDFWKNAATKIVAGLLKEPEKIGRHELASLLQSQLEGVLKDKALQKILHWELGEKNKVLRKVADDRESLGEELFRVILPDFEGSNTDLRARLALIIGGIYYLSLHAKTNGSTFCGIDLNLETGKEAISNAIRDLIFEAYEKAGVEK